MTVFHDPVVEGRIVHRIAYGDLDLANQSDKSILHQRIDRAVGKICRPNYLMWDRINCARHAWDVAGPQIERAVERSSELASRDAASATVAAIVIVTAH